MARTHDWRRWNKQRLALYESAKALYDTRRKALHKELEATFLPEVPQEHIGDAKRLISRIMAELDGTQMARQRRATALDPHYRISELTRLLEANTERLDQAISDTQGNPVNFADAQTYRIFVNTSRDLYAQMESVASSLDVEDQWGAEKQQWMARKKAIYTKVYREYKGKGEVYSMLCDRLAALQVGLSRLEALGRIDSDQYKNLSEQFVATAAQIQRHTESLKVEDVSPLVQQVGQKFFQILEARLFNQPALLDQIEEDIAGNVIEGKFEPGAKVKLLEAAQAS